MKIKAAYLANTMNNMFDTKLLEHWICAVWVITIYWKDFLLESQANYKVTIEMRIR